ncbi:MAG: class I SAM-dependent methyltransferase [Methyloceanibacter sp.]|jgi:SAM-dependent methyltransferase
MAFVEGVMRPCPQCGSEAFQSLPSYSAAPWEIVKCSPCGFVFLRNPPDYKHLVSEFAWEKTRVAEVERRKSRSPVRMWRDRMTRWCAGIYSPGITGRLKRMFAPGRVLDVGCGSGKKVPEPFIPFGIEISEELRRAADAHMSARGGRAIHAPAVEGVKEFPDRYFTGILLRSFLEHEAQPKALLAQCARVLTDDGAVYVRVPNFGSLNRRVLGAKWCGFRYPDHVNYFTTRSLAALAGGGLRLTLLNPVRLPLDDNINAVLKRGRDVSAVHA